MLTGIIDDQLAEERRLKESLAQRSTVVITSSGTLVTLSLGVAALITRVQSFKVPGTTLVAIGTALALLIIAAVVSLIVNAPWFQEAIDLGTLPHQPTANEWQRPNHDLAVEAYQLRVRLISDIRNTNRARGHCLLTALTLECAALVALSVAVGAILLAAP